MANAAVDALKHARDELQSAIQEGRGEVTRIEKALANAKVSLDENQRKLSEVEESLRKLAATVR